MLDSHVGTEAREGRENVNGDGAGGDREGRGIGVENGAWVIRSDGCLG